VEPPSHEAPDVNADPSLQELNAYVDGELHLSRQLEIEARLRDDDVLRAQVESLNRLRDHVRSHTDYHAAPAALRTAIARASGSIAPDASMPDASRHAPSPARQDARATLRRWFAWRPLASALAVAMCAVVGINLVLSPGRQEDRLREEIVASHARATMTEHLVDVASSDHHTVKPFLSSRLDFSPPVRELTLPGSVFLGGRVDYLDGRPVAALVYRQGKHVVDSYVWPTQDADSAIRISSLRGFHLARWSRQGMAHCLISDVSPDVFAAIAKELELAP
jgi:anti-sigma factor RsiW